MSDDDSETLYSESERSEDSDDSHGSLVDFLADSDEEPEVCPSCHTEICVSNILTKKRRRTEVVADDHESSCNESDPDDDSDYVPSEAGLSSEDESSCDESDCWQKFSDHLPDEWHTVSDFPSLVKWQSPTKGSWSVGQLVFSYSIFL